MQFDKNTYFIREHVGMLKINDTYDILDPETQNQIAIAKESRGFVNILFGMFMNNQMLPTTVHVYEGSDPDSGDVLFSIVRGFTLFRSTVQIVDGQGNSLGYFKEKMLTFGKTFLVYDENDNEVALVKGDWAGWNFEFTMNNETIGVITKKWSGLGKELFTSADNYMVDIHGDVSPSKATLLLAAGLAIDTVFKEDED